MPPSPLASAFGRRLGRAGRRPAAATSPPPLAGTRRPPVEREGGRSGGSSGEKKGPSIQRARRPPTRVFAVGRAGGSGGRGRCLQSKRRVRAARHSREGGDESTVPQSRASWRSDDPIGRRNERGRSPREKRADWRAVVRTRQSAPPVDPWAGRSLSSVRRARGLPPVRGGRMRARTARRAAGGIFRASIAPIEGSFCGGRLLGAAAGVLAVPIAPAENTRGGRGTRRRVGRSFGGLLFV